MKREWLQKAHRYATITIVCTVCLLCQLMLFVPPVQAATGEEVMWGSSTLVQRYFGRDSNDVELSVFPDGNATAVWRQFDGTYYSVYANHYVNGVGWGTEEVIEFDKVGTEFYSGNIFEPKVGALSNGGATVIWEKSALDNYMFGNTYSTGSGWGSSSRIGHCLGPGIGSLRAAFNSANKGMAVWNEGMGMWGTICSSRYVNGWGSPQIVVSINPGYTWFPDVDVDDGWGAMAVWEHNEFIHASLYDGSDWSAHEQIQTDTSSWGFTPKVAVAPSGTAIAGWAQSPSVWANRYNPGTGWGTAEIIATQDGDHLGIEVAIDNNNNAIAVWSQDNGTYGSRSDIWSNRYVDGVGWGTAELIETNDSGDAKNPEISVDGNGNAIAVWAGYDGTSVSAWSNRFIVGSGWGTAELIESSGGDVGFPKMGLDDAGNGIAVWTQSDDIWANRYINGTGWGTPELIENDRTYDAEHPQIAVSVSGSAIAVWQQLDSGVTSIWANRHTGSGWDTAVVIEPDNYGDAFDPQIAIDPNGNAVAVWTRYEYMTAGTNVLQAGIYTVGSGWTFNWVISNPSSDTTDPQVAIDKNGNAVAVWVASTDIYANRYVPGTGWGTVQMIQKTTSGVSDNPQVAVDAGGNATAIWEQYGDVWANRYDVVTGWGMAELVETTGGVMSKPQISVEVGGDAMVVWQQSIGGRIHVWANKYVAGVGWGVATLVETNASADSTNPVVALDAYGNAIAAWQQPDGGVASIWANRYVGGVGWGTAELIEFDDSGAAGPPQVSIMPGGNAVAVWHQSDGTRNNIYGNKYVVGDGWGTPELLETSDGDAINPQVDIATNGDVKTVWQQKDGLAYRIWGNTDNIRDIMPPTVPLNVRTVSKENYIELLWDPPLDDGGMPITKYKVYRGNSPGAEAFLAEVMSGTTFTDSCHSPQVAYYYKVSAVNEVDEGPRSGSVAGKTTGSIWVGSSGVGNCSTIKAAIDTALPGDTVRVHGGNYAERLTIGKTISLIGENKATTTVTGIGWQEIILVTADWVNISGLTLKSDDLSSALNLDSVSNCTIEDNVISRNKNGILLQHASDIDISSNDILDNSRHGVVAALSDRVALTNNSLSNNSKGLYADYSTGIDLTGNNISGGSYGVSVSYSENTTMSNNSVHDAQQGIVFNFSSNMTVIGNEVRNNEFGIRFLLPYGNSKVHHNNFIGNSYQATDNGDNAWDDGYPTGGNYWSDYTGRDMYGGPAQDQPGGDGLGDTPYKIVAGPSYDRYPLMYPVQPPPWRPSAPQNLSATAGNGEVALTWERPASDGGSPVVNYTLYRGTGQGEEAFLVELGDVLGYTDTGLTNGQGYYYLVAAKNAVGEGPVSNGASATPAILPGSPLNLMAVRGNQEIALTWSPPLDDGGFPITNYSVYRGQSSGGETFLVELGNVLTYIDKGLVNGQAYFYYVRAKTVYGEGLSSNEASETPGTRPSVPLNLLAVAGDTNVTLTWDAPASDGGFQVTNYSIYRGLTSSGKSLLVTIGNVLSYIDTGLTNGQRHFYQVSAVNIEGEGPRSVEAVAMPATHPSEPLDLKAFAYNGLITLSWSPPVSTGFYPITNYTVYRGLTSGGETLLTVLGKVYAYSDTNVTNGQTYFYRVTASNVVGEGPPSNEANATPATKPSEPLNLSAMAGIGQVTLTWDAPAIDGGFPITNYSVFRGTRSGATSRLATIGNTLTFTDIGLTNGQTYFYQVSAITAKGEGPRSMEANATPATLPSEPLNLQASADDGTVLLTWSAPAANGGFPIINYTIHRGLASGAESHLATIGAVLTFTDTGLTNGQTYYYKVSATTVIGEGPNSTEASAKPTTVPSEPLNLVAVGGNSTVTLTWDAPASDGGSPITGYRIYQGLTPGGETFLTDVGNVLTKTITALVNGQTYYYKVSAINSVGEGPLSSEAGATPVTLPTEPIGLLAVAGDSKVTLTWLAPSDTGGLPVTNYTIYRGTTSGGETFLLTLGDVRIYNDTGLVNGVTYFYTITAVNANGHSPNSNEVSATPASVPSEPLGLQSSTVWSDVLERGHIMLSWKPPADDGGSSVTHYRIYRGTQPGMEVFLSYVSGLTTFNDTTALTGQTYYYRVSAVNAIGEGPRSTAVNETIEPRTTPPSTGLFLDEPWFWAGMLILIFTVLLLLGFLVRRKMQSGLKEEIRMSLEEKLEQELIEKWEKEEL